MFRTAALFLAILLQASISPAQAVAVDQNKRFTPEELSADLDFFLKTIEEAHFDPFTVTSEAQMRKRIQAAKAEIRTIGGMTQKEFWLIYGQLVSAIGDSHSYVVDPRFFIKGEEDTTKYFPIFTEYVGGKIIVKRSFADEPVKPGLVIEKINGVPSTELVRRLSGHSFGNRREKAVKSVQWLWVGAAEVFGRPEVFAVEFEDGRKLNIRGLLLPEIVKRQQAAASGNPASAISESPLQLNFLDGGSAYLNSTSFSFDLQKYRQLLVDYFGKIRQAGSKALIIDVRANGGGNSALGDALIEMFNAKPYRGYSMKWKRSDQYVAEMERRKLVLPDFYLKMKPGEIYEAKSGMIEPMPNSIRFDGPVYVLSSRDTFSSGQMFLAVIKDNRLATIIGEETDAPVCNFGETFFFNLPNTKLRTSLSVKQWAPPGGCNGSSGVIPDVPIDRRIDDYIAGRDAVLEGTLLRINARK